MRVPGVSRLVSGSPGLGAATSFGSVKQSACVIRVLVDSRASFPLVNVQLDDITLALNIWCSTRAQVYIYVYIYIKTHPYITH